jgi:hypothetical protein
MILIAISVRWWLLLGVMAPDARPSFGVLALINWIGLGIGQVALGVISGDAIRVLYIQRRVAGWGLATRSVLVDRLMGLAGLGVVVIGALGAALGVAFSGLAALAGAGFAALCWFGFDVLQKRGALSRLVAVMAPLFTDLRKLSANSAGWIGLALTIAGHLMNIGVFYAMSRAFALHPDFAATFVAVPGGIFGSALPVSLGGWGVRELSVTVLFDVLGAPFHEALLASVLFGLSHVAMGVPGLVLFVVKPRGIIGTVTGQTGENR